MMRLAAALLLAMLSAAALAQAPAAAPLVRSSLVPPDGIVIGQPVLLHVTVLFPGEMPRPPLVKVAEAPGAQILRFETQAITIRDNIDGQDYVGQTFEFVVFPRRGGEIAVPAAEVTLLDRAGDPVGSTKGQPLRFVVTVPAGIDPSGPVLAAPNVRVRESWSPDPASASLKVGGAITRTIRREAANVPALGMAEFRFTAPEGVRAYVDPPRVDDKVDRGSVEGVRTDKVTYVFEKPGTYVLPALSQPWWDTDDRQVRSEALDGVTIAVSAVGTPISQDWRGQLWARRNLIAAGLGGLLLVSVLAWLRPRWVEAQRHRRERYLNSEAFARKALRDVARTGDAPATYRALQTWLTRLPTSTRQNLDSRVQALIAQLERSLFGDAEEWSRQSGAELATLARQAGRRSLGNQTVPASALPPLNPANGNAEYRA
jgi:hypothetical protein